MKLRIEKLPLAVMDLEEQAVFVSRDSPETATRFLKKAEEAFEMLASMPLIGCPYVSDVPYYQMETLRTWHIPGFDQHRIFYIPSEHTIQIVRILYTTRRVDPLL